MGKLKVGERPRKETSMALFHPLEEKFVVAGTREEWVKRCEEALQATPERRILDHFASGLH
jgi:hypothetical protein